MGETVKGWQRLDVQLSLIFVAILSVTVSLTGWIHQRGHFINLVGPHFEYEAELAALETHFPTAPLPVAPEAGTGLLQKLQPHLEPDRVLLLVDETFRLQAQTTPPDSLIELVRKEPDPEYFVVTTSSIEDRFDFILIFHMLPYRMLPRADGTWLYLLLIPRPHLRDVPKFRPILFDGLLHHFEIFGVFYAVVVAFFVLFIRYRLMPLRRIEAAAGDLIAHRLPEPICQPQRHDEVGRLVQAFNAAVARLGENEATRKRMVADIAHELRTPLTNVSGRIEAYQDGLINDHRALIDFTADQIDHLARIVEDLALLNRFDAGELVLQRQVFDLKAALSQRLAVAAFGDRFQWTIAGERCQVVLDPNRLNQMIDNLIANALQAMPSGLVLSLSLAPASADEGMVQLTFADNGPGVPAADLPHLFERLYRVDRARGQNSGGSGLGLSIVKSLVCAHGGTLRCFAVEPRGLGFVMLLPIAPAGTAAIKKKAEVKIFLKLGV